MKPRQNTRSMNTLNLSPAYRDFLASIHLLKNYHKLPKEDHTMLIEIFLLKIPQVHPTTVGLDRFSWVELRGKLKGYVPDHWSFLHLRYKDRNIYAEHIDFPQYRINPDYLI